MNKIKFFNLTQIFFFVKNKFKKFKLINDGKFKFGRKD